MDYGARSSHVPTTLPSTPFVPCLCSSDQPSAGHPHLHMRKLMLSCCPLCSWVTGLSYFVSWFAYLAFCFSPILQNEGFVYKVAETLVVENWDNRETLVVWIGTTGRHTNVHCLSGVTLSSWRAITWLHHVSCQHTFPNTEFPAQSSLLGSSWSSWIRINLRCFKRESFVSCLTSEGPFGRRHLFRV